MTNVKMPKAWLQAGAKQEEKKEVTARIDMSAEVAGKGLCPDCKKSMERAIAGGVECYVCQPDRIAIPVADEDLQQATE